MKRCISSLALLLGCFVFSKASTAPNELQRTSRFQRFQRRVDDDNDGDDNNNSNTVKPNSENDNISTSRFRIFPFDRDKLSEKEDIIEKRPSEDDSKKKTRFGIRKVKSDERSNATRGAAKDKKEEPQLNKDETNHKGATKETPRDNQSNKVSEVDMHIDASNVEDQTNVQPKPKLFRFGSGIKKKKESPSNVNPIVSPSSVEPGGPPDTEQEEEDLKSIAEQKHRPDVASTNEVSDDVQRKPSKPLRLRFGVRVREPASDDVKNVTVPSSPEDRLVLQEESRTVKPSKDERHDEQESKSTIFRSQDSIPANQGLKELKGDSTTSLPSANVTAIENDNEDSSANVTTIDKDREVVNTTRQEVPMSPREPPMSISPPFNMHGGPTIGYPMHMQQPGSGVIIMGVDGRGRGPPANRQQQLPGQPAPTTAIIAEAIATVISTGIRFWFLTSLTRWFADEEIKSLKKPTQHFIWERLNDRHTKDSDALQSALRARPVQVSERRWRYHVRRGLRKEQQLTRKNKLSVNKGLNDVFDRTVIVMELSKSDKGDCDIAYLEDVVNFILSEHRRKAFGVFNSTAVEIEVIVLVESPGGAVSEFGLGAAQLRRLTDEEGIKTTVCVDKIAASGGYMIASQANKVVAAPFAIVGSIGVIREGLNFNKALQKYGVLPMVLTAGDAKAPLSTFGEITKGGLEIAQKNLEKIHGAFRELVVRGRPVLEGAMEIVADGDIFLGLEALDLKLVDEVMTSEEYIMERIQTGDRVLKIHRIPSSMRNRRLTSLHPLDFLRENGPQWFAHLDIPKVLSRVLQTSTFLKFIQYLVQHHLI